MKTILLFLMMLPIVCLSQLSTSSSVMSKINSEVSPAIAVELNDSTLIVDGQKFNVKNTLKYTYDDAVIDSAQMIFFDKGIIDIATAYYSQGNLYKLRLRNHERNMRIEFRATNKL